MKTEDIQATNETQATNKAQVTADGFLATIFLDIIENDSIPLENIDWRLILRMLTLRKETAQSPHQNFTIRLWCLLYEIDDEPCRAQIIRYLQAAVPECFDTQEEITAFGRDLECIRIALERSLKIYAEGAERLHVYQDSPGENGLNELATLWSIPYVNGKDLVALAAEEFPMDGDQRETATDPFFYALWQRNDNISFDNIGDFCNNLYTAEMMRQFLVEGKIYDSYLMGIADFNRRLRNACFDEYIRLRIEQLRAQLESDNTLLLEPTDAFCLKQLYYEDRAMGEALEQKTNALVTNNPNLQRYLSERMNLVRYLLEYMDWKITRLDANYMNTYNTQIIHGDYVAGDKIVNNQPQSQPQSQPRENAQTQQQNGEELFRYIHYSVIDEEQKLAVHKEICNIVHYPKMSLVCVALKEMKNDKKILSSIEPAAMLAELRRLGMPYDTKGFSDQNFFSSYNK